MSDNNALALRPQTSLSETVRIGEVMAQSGFFQDSRQAAQAIVKILAGQEMGFGPFASMTGVHIIQGRPAVGANLMAAAVKGSGRYDYRVKVMTDAVCEIAFFQAGQEIGVSRFTKEDAQKAGTKNMDKFARNMLFARAMSNGVRWYCPDVFNGSAVYTPEELGATTDQDGNVIEGSYTQTPPITETSPAPVFYTPGQSILYKGDRDERAGVVVEDGGNGLVLVRIGDKEFKAKRERLTPAPDFDELQSANS